MTILALALFAAGSMVNPESLAMSMTLRFLIAFSFPFLLFLLRFYKPEEIAKMGQIYGRVYGFIKSRF